MTFKYTIISVTYNSAEIIEEFLSQFKDHYLKIIIVDNNSTDSTIEKVKNINANSKAEIEVIQSKKNNGFARANNLALKSCGTELALLLNPDCKIKVSDIEILATKSELFEEISICSGVIVNRHGNKESIPKTKVENSKFSEQNLVDAKFISGCCMLIKIRALDKIGYFDEGFFMYCEDNELCKRVIKNNLKLAVSTEVPVLHIGGGSSKIDKDIFNPILPHRLGWSKCYYTQKVHNKPVAILKAIRDFIRSTFKLLLLNRSSSSTRGEINKQYAIKKGCKAFLLNKKAFNADGSPQIF